MFKKEYTLSDAIDFFKKNNIPSFEEEIDQYGGYFLTAARLTAVILAPTPLAALSNFCSGIDVASLRVSKLFSWLPDKFKYKNRGRERLAIHRYELSSIIYIKLLDIAILNGFKEVVAPELSKLLKDITLEEDDQYELLKITKEAENDQYRISINPFAKIDTALISEIVGKITDPLLAFLIKKTNSKNKKDIQISSILNQYAAKTYNLFNAFLVNLSSEFPDFHLWLDIKNKKEILDEVASIKQGIIIRQDLLEIHKKFEFNTKIMLDRLELLNRDQFMKTEGFPSFDNTFEGFFKIQTETIIDKIDEKVKNNIIAHHNKILKDVELPLSDDDAIDEIVYPRNKDIYIAQSFYSIVYKKKEHKKIFLTVSYFDTIAETGEDVGKLLLKNLIDPNSAVRPIIILGNPGAGKSMLSKMFAAKLCTTHDYIPFLVRLRDVASNSSNISEHINKGIAKSIGLTQEINWIEWAKLFTTRIPVIILDGFDELMQSSIIELNGYIHAIKELQESALLHNICLRIILTSRIAVMQDVTIPDGTTIIKLNPFDEKRKEAWINKWNSFQTKHAYKFALPKNSKISDLAQEPLLLFMLAIYDFPSAELQSIAHDRSFNQSKLYDSLLTDFGTRQLEKEENYRNANAASKKDEEELFRLRLGMIALLMFLNDTTNKDIQRLDEELKICKLDASKIKPIDVLTGFFFVHENKATTESEKENYNYEFSHKSFGEFLTADFLLRIALKQKDRKSKDLELFQFCYGYNWLHKQPEVQRFLFEHTHQVFDFSKNEQERIIEEIQDALAGLFDRTLTSFPISRFTIIEPRSKIEHLAIYSQNLVFLWLALHNPGVKVPFDISGNTKNSTSQIPKEETFSYLAQDREESNNDKVLWKRITYLWQLAGNYQAVAKLFEWIEVSEENNIILKRRKDKMEVRHNFLDASIVACNDFNYIMSLFDNEIRITDTNTLLARIRVICTKKPELTAIANDALISRIPELVKNNEPEIFSFLFDKLLTTRQLADVSDRFIASGDLLPENKRAEIGEKLFNLTVELKIIHTSLKLLNYLIRHQHLAPLTNLFSKITHVVEILIKYLDLNKDSLYTVITFFKQLTDIYSKLPNIKLTHHKLLDVAINRFKNDFTHLVRNNPGLVIEYLKMLISFRENRELNVHFKPAFLEELFDQVLSELRSASRENSNYTDSHLKILIELSSFFPAQKFINSRLFEEIINRFGDNTISTIDTNPQLALEYLQLIKVFSKKYNIKGYLRIGLIEDLLNNLVVKLNSPGGEDVFFLLEFFKLVNEFHEIVSIQSFSRSKAFEFFIKPGDKFKHIFYNTPSLTLEYCKALKAFRAYPDKLLISGLLDRLFSELTHTRKTPNSSSLLDYLKLMNGISKIFPIKELIPPETGDELIHKFKDHKHIIYSTPLVALEYLKFILLLDNKQLMLDAFPQFKDLYQDNPDRFMKYAAAFFNIFDNENRN